MTMQDQTTPAVDERLQLDSRATGGEFADYVADVGGPNTLFAEAGAEPEAQKRILDWLGKRAPLA